VARPRHVVVFVVRLGLIVRLQVVDWPQAGACRFSGCLHRGPSLEVGLKCRGIHHALEEALQLGYAHGVFFEQPGHFRLLLGQFLLAAVEGESLAGDLVAVQGGYDLGEAAKLIPDVLLIGALKH